MGFFNFEKKPSEGEVKNKREVRGDDELKKEVKKIFVMRKQIFMDRIAADKVIEDKLDLDEANLIDEMGREKYNELLAEIEKDFERNRDSV